MPYQGESKTCGICCMEIPVGARKCPYCRHWQYRLTQIVAHPFFGIALVVVIFVPLIAVYFMLMSNLFSRGELLRDYADQITIVESKLEFGFEEDEQKHPTVAIVGKVKNSSNVDWKDVRLQAEFFNSKGDLIDAGQEQYRSPFLPANQEIGFKISFPRQFPESQYTNHKVRVFFAVDNKSRF